MNTPAIFVLMCLAHAPTNYSTSAPTNHSTPAPTNYSISEDRLHRSEIACLDRRDAFVQENPDQRGRCKCQSFNEAPQTSGILPGASPGDPGGGSTFRQPSANASGSSGNLIGSMTLGQPGAKGSGNGAPRSVSPN